MPTRGEGYQRAVGKEELALRVAEDFFRTVLGLEPLRINDRDENYTLGDFRFRGGTVECKGQPIDPDRYRQNFVEVFEAPDNKRGYHLAGFDQVAGYLGATSAELEGMMVAERRADYGGGSGPLGRIEHVSVSITSMTNSLYVVYVNSGAGHLYLYSSRELVALIANRVRAGGLMRGLGDSNDDTFAVMVPLPDYRWKRTEGEWHWTGAGEEEPAIESVRNQLSP